MTILVPVAAAQEETTIIEETTVYPEGAPAAGGAGATGEDVGATPTPGRASSYPGSFDAVASGARGRGRAFSGSASTATAMRPPA